MEEVISFLAAADVVLTDLLSDSFHADITVSGGSGAGGGRSGVGLWFASAFDDVEAVAAAVRAGVGVGLLSPIDPREWWASCHSALRASPPKARANAQAAIQLGRGAGWQRQGPVGAGLRELGMDRVSALHLALRWQSVSSARMLIASGGASASAFIRSRCDSDAVAVVAPVAAAGGGGGENCMQMLPEVGSALHAFLAYAAPARLPWSSSGGEELGGWDNDGCADAERRALGEAVTRAQWPAEGWAGVSVATKELLQVLCALVSRGCTGAVVAVAEERPRDVAAALSAAQTLESPLVVAAAVGDVRSARALQRCVVSCGLSQRGWANVELVQSAMRSGSWWVEDSTILLMSACMCACKRTSACVHVRVSA